MKVKELIAKLSTLDGESYVHIQTDRRFEEDIVQIESYETESAKIVVLSNHYKTRKPQ